MSRMDFIAFSLTRVRLYGSAELPEARDEILVAAIDGIDISEGRTTLRGEHRDHEHRPDAQHRRTDDLGRLKVRGSGDGNAMRVMEKGVCAEAVKLRVVDRALIVDPVVKHRRSLRLCRDNGEEGQVVHIESGVRARVDAFGEGNEPRGLNNNVGEARNAVFGRAELGY